MNEKDNRQHFRVHPSSYRDPSGFIFQQGDEIYRQVNTSFAGDYDLLFSNGLYKKLTDRQLLIPHEEINNLQTNITGAYKIIKPQKIDFISYPYEWSFDMLRDAALLTLQLVKEALNHQMILKDATPYNIQWHKGKLIFIDTLSFEQYAEGQPWIAYRQFCENFLSPLLLMYYSKRHLQQLLLAYPEGIPLDVTSSLLPFRSRFSLNTYLHIHLHTAVSRKKKNTAEKKVSLPLKKLQALINSLYTFIGKLKAPPADTVWADYYSEAATRNSYLAAKKEIIKKWVATYGPFQKSADLGANDGELSKLLAAGGASVLTVDFDPSCINRLYNEIKLTGAHTIQPLLNDLSNPSPAIGVNNRERASFAGRLQVDLSLALALIHHLSIGKNIPFNHVAEFFQATTEQLIIEFVPKNDPKVQLILQGKKDIYTSYTQENFEKAFEEYFLVRDKQIIQDSERILYFMTRK